MDNAGDEASVVLERVDAALDPAFGDNAATRDYGDFLKSGIIDSGKISRLALQNVVSIAALLLGTDCLITQALEGVLPLP